MPEYFIAVSKTEKKRFKTYKLC